MWFEHMARRPASRADWTAGKSSRNRIPTKNSAMHPPMSVPTSNQLVPRGASGYGPGGLGGTGCGPKPGSGSGGGGGGGFGGGRELMRGVLAEKGRNESPWSSVQSILGQGQSKVRWVVSYFAWHRN